MQKFFSSCSGKHFYPFFPYPVQTEPRFELHCSSDVVHIRTCSDSCAALMNLIQYIASYGDLHAANRADMKPGAPQRKMKVQLPTYSLELTQPHPMPATWVACFRHWGLLESHRMEGNLWAIICLFLTFRVVESGKVIPWAFLENCFTLWYSLFQDVNLLNQCTFSQT